MTCNWCGLPIHPDPTQRRGYQHDLPLDPLKPLPAVMLRAQCLTQASPDPWTPDSVPYGPWPGRAI